MSDFQPPIVDHHAPEVPDPTYEPPTLTEIVDIIDLLRPWEHGFTWVGFPPYGSAVCDCGWFWYAELNAEVTAVDGIKAYRQHVGYEE